MPAPGDQHKSNGATTANPFEESKPHISEYTAQEIATLQSRLNKRLGPEFISTRPGPGNQKVAYLSAEKAINLANEVFGFNGWSSSIQNIQIDFVDENAQSGKVTIGLSVVVRVTLRDGTYHEDIGYGGIENCKGKAMAFEKSKKEATTDALKRALRSFGNVLGNCMYDRDFITKVSKIKAGNGKFDVNELHRHPDYAPKTNEDAKPVIQKAQTTTHMPSLELEDSFDVSEFDDIDFNDNDLAHPDEVVLPADIASARIDRGITSGFSTVNTPSKAPQSRSRGGPVTSNLPGAGQMPANANGIAGATSIQAGISAAQRPRAAGTENQRGPDGRSSSPGLPSVHFDPDAAVGSVSAIAPMAPPAGFYSARAATAVDPHNSTSLPPSTVRFNPHSESPSIRKTAGVDHTKSVPVRREIQKVEPSPPPNLIDPRGDANRRVGMPGPPAQGAVGRSGMSTSAYRPPTRHGSPAIQGQVPNLPLPSNLPEKVLTAAKRPPLGDLSNMQHNTSATIDDGAEAKRQKVNPAGTGPGGAENTSNHKAVAGL